MMKRMAFLAGAAVGYVVGTRAGRERYEQIRQASRRVTENPTVQETAGLLRAQAEDMAGSAKEKVTSRLHDSRLGDRLPGLHGSEQATGTSTAPGTEAAADQMTDRPSAATLP